MRWKSVAPIAGAVLLLTVNAWSAGSSEDEILEIENQRIQAMIAGDLATLERLLADDLSYVHSTGQVESKQEFLARLKSGDLKYRAMPREEVKVRILGCAAIVTGKAKADVESKGLKLSFPMRFTDIYVKRAERWQLIAWQSTRMP
jgi:ketosteroid isomerase-like protein